MLNLTAFLSYVFVVTFTPGPNNILSVANASKYGFRKTLKFILGVFIGFFIVMIFCSYFNLMLYNIMPKVKTVMSVFGALYMTYLAFKIMRSRQPSAFDDNVYKGSKGNSELNSLLTGITMQFINPKVILYGITVISNFIIPYYKSNIFLLMFSIFLALIALIATSSWALFGSLFNKFLSKYKKQFNIIMGLILIYSALSIF